ncbi:WD40/YVTN/BNR-like repeat-containing protein [Pelagicoccus mobilis]|uniref:Exo-alpha-sialidase n=1 Tax=Pelagicoccus mobilis TaxID=415221 RepID=A0A934VSH1_9BACT|nr:sialidase family protein [Pelagicoccus mobilis]MBK1878663.1 exo-alpha-sialidase [Pelagicoccus mobilis]
MNQLLITTRKGLFIYTPAADGSYQVSQTAFLGDPVTLALYDKRSGYLYAALKHGHFGCKLHRSKDNGASWEEIATPAYPAFPEGRAPDRCPMRQIEIPWKLELIWALTPGGDDQVGRIWCGTIPGGLFKSDDHGDSWELVESLWNNPARQKWFGGGYDFPGIHSVCVDPRDSEHVTLGISCGGVWKSKDDGTTWQQAGQGLRAAYLPPDQAHDPEAQDPHLLTQCKAEPDNLWTQHHNGIFKSQDGGQNFTEIEEAGPSTFGFAVAVHPSDPETAWFAPAIKDEQRYPVDGKFVITRTRDGGKSFETLRKGLPQEHSYDLIYRHALAVDDSGENLLTGSTTGNLWLSPDQGDTWQTISNTLPPIYSVAFI